MADDTKERTTGEWTASKTLTAAGVVLLAFGLVGAVLLWSEMSGSGFGDVEYGTVEKWLALITASVPVGLGLAVAGIGTILGRIENR